MKITVHLEELNYRRLKAIGRRFGRAWEAVAEFVKRRGRPRNVQSLGVGRSGQHGLSERSKDLLGGSSRG